jgi:hypothetical protein
MVGAVGGLPSPESYTIPVRLGLLTGGTRKRHPNTDGGSLVIFPCGHTIIDSDFHMIGVHVSSFVAFFLLTKISIKRPHGNCLRGRRESDSILHSRSYDSCDIKINTTDVSLLSSYD